MFNSEGFCGSLNSLVKSKVRLRNTAHPFNSLLWLYPTSEAIKNVFIEGRGETLTSSWDCRAADEVINMKTNMTAMYDESQTTRDVVLSLFYWSWLFFRGCLPTGIELKRAMHHASLGIITEYWSYAIGAASQWQDENGLHDKRIEK